MPDNKLYYGDNLVVLREHLRDSPFPFFVTGLYLIAIS